MAGVSVEEMADFLQRSRGSLNFSRLHLGGQRTAYNSR